MKHLVVRRFFYGLLTVAVFASNFCATTPIARAAALNVHVRADNRSDRAVYFTFWWKYDIHTSWRQEGGFCLKAGESRNQYFEFTSPVFNPEVSVWAEIKKDKRDCGGAENTVRKFIRNFYPAMNMMHIGRTYSFVVEVSGEEGAYSIHISD